MNQRFSDLIVLLSSGVNQRRMYFDGHPKVQSISREFLLTLQVLLRDADSPEFKVGVFNRKFIHDGKYLVGPSIAGRSLIDFAEQLHCGGFIFQLPLSPADLITFFRLAAEQKEPTANLQDARDKFAAAGVTHIIPTVPFPEEEKENDADEFDLEALSEVSFMAADFAPLLEVYQSLYETVAENAAATRGSGRIDLSAARSHGQELVTVSNRGALDVMHFMRYPDFDSYTIGHSVRVAALAALVSRTLAWPREVQNEIATAGLLHDLGKGRIPDKILYKNARLDPAERRVIETHPMLGAEILADNGEASPIVMSATWGHHLREDGGGYPAVPRWFHRSSAAALIHVCDIFEALTAARPYKKPMCPRRAYEIMVASHETFQPAMLTALIRTLGLYPPGSEVLLTDFRRAVVTDQGPQLENPQIRITHDASGSPLPRGDQPAIMLVESPEVEIAEFITVDCE